MSRPLSLTSGGALDEARTDLPTTYERYAVTVASGFIAGEALLGGLVLPAVSWFSGP